MSKYKWKNITSYDQGDMKRVPVTWELKLCRIRVCITCGHIHYKPRWILNVSGFLDQVELIGVKEGPEGLEEAKLKALEIISKLANDIKLDLEIIYHEHYNFRL